LYYILPVTGTVKKNLPDLYEARGQGYTVRNGGDKELTRGSEYFGQVTFLKMY